MDAPWVSVEVTDMVSAEIRRGVVRAVLGIVGAALLSATWGCSHVAPYERGNLAHPTMSAEDPFTTPLATHVEDVSEGATGGLSGGGGGCGCN
ncbi:MAG TPA: DUF4266 domain-containing protein [Polyangiaceae bacterium]|jgi:hypothetical protein